VCYFSKFTHYNLHFCFRVHDALYDLQALI